MTEAQHGFLTVMRALLPATKRGLANWLCARDVIDTWDEARSGRTTPEATRP